MKSIKYKSVPGMQEPDIQQVNYTTNIEDRDKWGIWNHSDRANYQKSTENNIGQIGDIPEYKDRTKLANWIKKLSSDKGNKTFLEIGAWNGLGSTKCFVDTLSSRDDDYIFYSLECNYDKFCDVRELYKKYPQVHILNEVINKGIPDDFNTIFPNINDTGKYQHQIDLDNINKCNLFLDRTDIPEVFDVLLLDGGSFTTYWEYERLKDKCKYLLLDDSKSSKNAMIAKEILGNKDEWEILEHWVENNGFMVIKNIKRGK